MCNEKKEIYNKKILLCTSLVGIGWHVGCDRELKEKKIRVTLPVNNFSSVSFAVTVGFLGVLLYDSYILFGHTGTERIA